MKKYLILGVLAVCLNFSSFVGAGYSVINSVAPLPEGLEAYYPPKADGPVYLFKMLALDGAFSGIAAELTSGDLDGARSLFKVFKTEYMLMKNMVDGWRDEFPEKEIEVLGIALEGSNKDLMYFSLENVGKVCHQCHMTAMVPVQQKFRWGNFSELDVKDVNGEGKQTYAAFKKFIAVNMAGVRVDAIQEQWESARKHFNTLKERFVSLTDTCIACHSEQPKYFLNPSALLLLESELRKDHPDSGKVNELLQSLGAQSCAGCHLIHVPAAVTHANSDLTAMIRKEQIHE